MLKTAHKDDYNAMLKRCEGASSSVVGASMRIMMSHFVALLKGNASVVCNTCSWSFAATLAVLN